MWLGFLSILCRFVYIRGRSFRVNDFATSVNDFASVYRERVNTLAEVYASIDDGVAADRFVANATKRLHGKRKALSALQQPYEGAVYTAFPPKDVCDHLCKSMCTYNGAYAGPGTSMCVNCIWSCMSFGTCDDSEACLEQAACSVYSFKKAIEAGNPAIGKYTLGWNTGATTTTGKTVEAWNYCKPDFFANDKYCKQCTNCVAQWCHYVLGTDKCGGPWGDCCHVHCLGKPARPW